MKSSSLACSPFRTALGWLTAVLVIVQLGCNGGNSQESPPTQAAEQKTVTQSRLEFSAGIAVIDDSMVSPAAKSIADELGAARFLWKAAFGPSEADIAKIQKEGYLAYINQQIATPASQYSKYMLDALGYPHSDSNPQSVNIPAVRYCNAWASGVVNGQPVTPESFLACTNWVFANSARTTAAIFLKSAVHDPDQLRLRTAFALSQIWVTSQALEFPSGFGMRMYQQLLRDNAFGYFDDMLKAVTLNPFMGRWLDMALSHKSNPNQNYARELLQLFSVGMYKLKPNGAYELDSQGERIESYTEKDVAEFSRALTGWAYPEDNTQTVVNRYRLSYGYDAGFHLSNPAAFEHQLYPMQTAHDMGSKVLLNGVTLPAGQTTEQDLDAVIKNLSEHPNTGPYIVRQLIQFLVTSNPSPAYVARVVKVFNTPDSTGRKRNMGRVVKAIMLDDEAINPPDNAAKLMEPTVRVAGLTRAMGAQTDGIHLLQIVEASGQVPFRAPSVFNFYPPDYKLPGSNADAPQFSLITVQSLGSATHEYHGYISSDHAPNTFYPKGYITGTQWNWPSSWLDMAGTDEGLAQLINILSTRLTGGVFDSVERSLIVAKIKENYSNGSTDAAKLARLRLAVFLITASPQFVAHR